MKFNLKSAFIAVFGLGFLALLAACESIDMPHVFGGNEVPQTALDEPRIVQQPTQAEMQSDSWPRLGDVPAKPNNFSSETQIDKRIFELQEDRAEGQEEMREYEELKAAMPSAEVFSPVTSDVPPQTANFLQPPGH